MLRRALPVTLRSADWRAAESVHRGVWIVARDPAHREVAKQALELLARYDRRRFRRVLRHAPQVHVGTADDVGRSHFRAFDGLVFVVSANRLDVAATLVHEATHALLAVRGLPYDARTWRRHEALCRREEARLARRLLGAAPLEAADREELARFASACEQLAQAYLAARDRPPGRCEVVGLDAVLEEVEALRRAWRQHLAASR
ncbi:MAG: hypothetical protein ACFCGT_00490 [Sandaracinaceae bacterium]